WSRWSERAHAAGIDADRISSHQVTLQQAFAVSDFLCKAAEADPEWVVSALGQGRFAQPWCKAEAADTLTQSIDQAADEAELKRILRVLRRRAMWHIVYRDLVLNVPLEETVTDMTQLAERLTDGALNWLYADACRQWGTPTGPAGQPVKMVVLGMGKLGAGELNVSSDIDLMFAFEHPGQTRGGTRQLDHSTFFTRLGQRLIQALDQITADGQVFRVDMRLRPYGQSGALALSFDAMETYYQSQGREWERYAMIKARPVAGDREAGARLMTLLTPFVYRKYIDFGVLESLRDMKRMIQQEVVRRNLSDNIKLGAGGIREIEFVVQAIQLLRGGRLPELRERNLLRVLKVMEREGLMAAPEARELEEAYRFLRKLEHALQGMDDRQTQTLPQDALGWARLVRIMGEEDEAALRARIEDVRARVSSHFADVVATETGETRERVGAEKWSSLWGLIKSGNAPGGTELPASLVSGLDRLTQGARFRQMHSQGQARLDRFVPTLIQALLEAEANDATIERTLKLVEAILRRSAYLSLLVENPNALKLLVELFAGSAWIAELITATPALLDELLNESALTTPPDKQSLEQELRQQLMRIPEEDLEGIMEALRQFRHAHVLRVAASELRGTLPLMKVSDYLTWVAEVVLQAVFDVAWHEMARRHGYPEAESEQAARDQFAIVGYGKLGGIELSYSSDLDLVFLHGETGTVTTGDRALDSSVFWTRLGQKMVHILSTRTHSGVLYEVDMRLRPSGNAGLLVSSFKAFDKYQRESAWTWEHQALVRARAVAGGRPACDAFESVRRTLLCQKRDPVKLLEDVRSMRERMFGELGDKHPGMFHLKHDRGGIVDIEFMVQYLALRWAHDYPDVVEFSDNIRILEALGRHGILSQEDAQQLIDLYRTLRARIHLLALDRQPARVPAGTFEAEREKVRACWQRVMGAPPDGA
ncbi:MAG: bifunctional [glutamate--ammonia ligase]-adenylyl-L-tyrosine phosphorylase/[glutamate--ammonia-ligase] adenylyltransferase, partial [Gammaproteobacteria bacterium]